MAGQVASYPVRTFNSSAPLNGMMTACGSLASIHSLILDNLEGKEGGGEEGRRGKGRRGKGKRGKRRRTKEEGGGEGGGNEEG